MRVPPQISARLLIAAARYVLAEDVAEFNRKLASDEFAGSVSNVSVVGQVTLKK
jgi:hypothetical protein